MFQANVNQMANMFTSVMQQMMFQTCHTMKWKAWEFSRPTSAAIGFKIPNSLIYHLALLMPPKTLQDRVAGWLVADDKEMAESPIRAHRNALQKIYAAWCRMVIMVFRTYLEIIQQSAADYLVSRNQGTMASLPSREPPATSKKQSKTESRVRRGIGQPLPRSTASKEWQFEPSTCAHAEEMLRQRGSKQMFWWTCLGCGSRWQRLEWEMDHVENTKASSSTDRAKAGEQKVTAASSATYPARLPPPKSRPDLKALVIQDVGVPSHLMPPSPIDEIDKSPAPARMTQGPILPPQAVTRTADQELERQILLAAQERKESRKKLLSGVIPAQPMSRPRTPHGAAVTETHVLNSSEEEESPLALQDFSMVSESR